MANKIKLVLCIFMCLCFGLSKAAYKPWWYVVGQDDEFSYEIDGASLFLNNSSNIDNLSITGRSVLLSDDYVNFWYLSMNWRDCANNSGTVTLKGLNKKETVRLNFAKGQNKLSDLLAKKLCHMYDTRIQALELIEKEKLKIIQKQKRNFNQQ